jgi:hypothetical protein
VGSRWRMSIGGVPQTLQFISRWHQVQLLFNIIYIV